MGREFDFLERLCFLLLREIPLATKMTKATIAASGMRSGDLPTSQTRKSSPKLMTFLSVELNVIDILSPRDSGFAGVAVYSLTSWR